MRRKRKSSPLEKMTLFPFLAVLVCTMGVLIILLVLVTKLADQKARQRLSEQEVQKAEQLEKLEMELELEQLRAEAIGKERPGLIEELKSHQDQRAQIEKELQSARQKIEQWKTRLVSLRQTGGAPQNVLANESVKNERNRLATEIKQLENRINTLTPGDSDSLVTYSIVPHQGTGGSRRRPIYVECDKEGLVFRPLGIRLRQQDFARPILPGNPFDSALLAIRQYWEEQGLDGEQPYPLLVVRPDGADAYGLARQAMKNWEDQFGYELVEQELKLQFGQPRRDLAGAGPKNHFRSKTISGQRGEPSEASSKWGAWPICRGIPGFRLRRVRQDVSRIIDRMESESNACHQWKKVSFDDAWLDRRTRSFHKFCKKINRRPGDKVSQKNPGKNANAAAAAEGNLTQGSQTSLARTRGSNWALPTRTPGATAYQRPIQIQLKAGRL